MVEILEHHAKNLQEDMQMYPDEVSLRKHLVNVVADYPSYVFNDEVLLYPGLITPERRAVFVEVQMKQAKALRDGTAVIIPEYDPDGTSNIDGQCLACGNLGTNNICEHEKLFKSANGIVVIEG
jgi:hypothetical protein